ncbi:MFS transporter [Candidatus Peregrinibacteria bacterium]|nr:MAG: MFS transporter [Candidatus Peregrinibacteria bacterium]
MKKIFHHLLINNLVAGISNAFVWFALTFWIFLETRSILATSLLGGTFAIANALTAFPFGHIVDHHKKKSAFVLSSLLSVSCYLLGILLYHLTLSDGVVQTRDPFLWIFVVVLMVGAVSGNLRNISLNPVVTMLFKEEERGQANGLVGMVNGVTFMFTSVLSGLAIGFLGMEISLYFALAGTVLTLLDLFLVQIPEKDPQTHEDHPDHPHEKKEKKNTLDLIRSTPGFYSLVFFAIFNNVLGGVFMALMDAYGLSLVSVQAWGFIWGGLSIGVMIGGAIVTKYGTGKDPLKRLILINLFTWITCIFFPLKASILWLIVGAATWMIAFPIIEASEQTIIQKVIPLKHQGRVTGFIQSIESSTSPLTTLMIGPLTQIWIVPFMTTGFGAQSIGSWFGTGQDRAMALVFVMAGIIGVIVSLFTLFSGSRRRLSKLYNASNT